MRREKRHAKSVTCAVSRPRPHSTKVCAGRCGCRSENIMKAFIVDRYGSKDGVRFGEMPDPELRDDDVLVRVHAVGVARERADEEPPST